MNISKIRVKNYKSFLDSGEIEIKNNIFAFIGQNNTGKSAILDAIQVFFPSSKKSVILENYHKSTDEDIEIEVWFSEVNNEYLESIFLQDKIDKQIDTIKNIEEQIKETDNDNLREKLNKEQSKLKEIRENGVSQLIEQYKIKDETLYLKLVVPKSGKNQYKLINDENIKDADVKKILPELRVIPALRDPKNESTAGTNSYLKDLLQMLDESVQTSIKLDGKTLTYKDLNRVLSEETKKRSQNLASAITKYYNSAIGNKDYRIEIESTVNISKGTSYNTVLIDKNNPGVRADIMNCGTGYQSMIILSILETYVEMALNRSNYILLVEEPEVYLHPKLQRRMIDALIRISKSNQVIFTSHSPITVSKLSRSDIRLVERIDGEAKVCEVEIKKVIDELGIKADDILHSKGIIFVEGKDDEIVVKELIRKLDESMADKINVIQADGCSKLKWYANAEVLINQKYSVPTLIIRDADVAEPLKVKQALVTELVEFLDKPQYDHYSQEEKEEIREKFQHSIIVLDDHSIEYFFINKDLLKEFVEDKVKLDNALQCYMCQYKKQLQRSRAGQNGKNVFERFFQPKRFLEGYPDQSSIGREANEISFKNRWNSLKESCVECSNELGIDNFLEIREALIKKTEQISREGSNVLEYLILKHDLNYLRECGMGNFIALIDSFLQRVTK